MMNHLMCDESKTLLTVVLIIYEMIYELLS
jgi:hypothetical protein